MEGVVSFTSCLDCLWFVWIQPLPVAVKGRNYCKQNKNDCVKKKKITVFHLSFFSVCIPADMYLKREDHVPRERICRYVYVCACVCMYL